MDLPTEIGECFTYHSANGTNVVICNVSKCQLDILQKFLFWDIPQVFLAHMVLTIFLLIFSLQTIKAVYQDADHTKRRGWSPLYQSHVNNFQILSTVLFAFMWFLFRDMVFSVGFAILSVILIFMCNDIYADRLRRGRKIIQIWRPRKLTKNYKTPGNKFRSDLRSYKIKVPPKSACNSKFLINELV